MKKSRLKIYRFLVLLFIPALFVACSSTEKDYSSPYDLNSEDAKQEVSDDDYPNEIGYDAEQGDYIEEVEKSADAGDGESADTSKEITDGKDYLLNDTHDKIIRKVNMDLETKSFDELVSSIETQVYELGGYVEESRITGRHYNSDNLRYGVMIIRIPRETVNGFLDNIGSLANVVEKAENVENVSLKYVDIESQKKSLEIEQERLISLLERTEKMEDIMSLEARLTTVRYELQNLATEIRTIDNLVDYSTITMNLQEVKLMSPSIEKEESVGTRIKRGFDKKIHKFSKGFEDFTVWFVLNLPLFIVIIIIVLVITIIVKKNNYKIFKKDNSSYKEDNKVNEKNNFNKTEESIIDSQEVNNPKN